MAWGEQAPIRPLPLTASRPTAQACSGFGPLLQSCIDLWRYVCSLILYDTAYTEAKHLTAISRTRELNQINLHAAVPVPYAAVRDSLPSPRGRRHGQPAQIGSFRRSSRDWKLVGTWKGGEELMNH